MNILLKIERLKEFGDLNHYYDYGEEGADLQETINELNEELLGDIQKGGQYWNKMYEGFQSNISDFASNVSDTFNQIGRDRRKWRGGAGIEMGSGWSGANLFQKEELDTALKGLKGEKSETMGATTSGILNRLTGTRDQIYRLIEDCNLRASGEDGYVNLDYDPEFYEDLIGGFQSPLSSQGHWGSDPLYSAADFWEYDEVGDEYDDVLPGDDDWDFDTDLQPCPPGYHKCEDGSCIPDGVSCPWN